MVHWVRVSALIKKRSPATPHLVPKSSSCATRRLRSPAARGCLQFDKPAIHTLPRAPKFKLRQPQFARHHRPDVYDSLDSTRQPWRYQRA